VFQQFQHEHTNGALLITAIAALSEVTNNSGPTNSLTALAFGQLGSCWLAWADLNRLTTNISEYTNAVAHAIQMYQTLLQDSNDTPADISARCQGEFGLGLIAERQHQPQEALTHYCKILFPADTRRADPAWVKDAGVKAAALYEEQKDWRGAEQVYRRIQQVVPSLAPEMQKNIDRVKSAAQAD
jgi:hypothetical protein